MKRATIKNIRWNVVTVPRTGKVYKGYQIYVKTFWGHRTRFFNVRFHGGVKGSLDAAIRYKPSFVRKVKATIDA